MRQMGAPSCSSVYSLSQAVEHRDVCIHVVGVVRVRWVTAHRPLLGLGALGGKHVATVFGLIVHTVEASDLSGKVSQARGSVQLEGPSPQTNLQLPKARTEYQRQAARINHSWAAGWFVGSRTKADRAMLTCLRKTLMSG